MHKRFVFNFMIVFYLVDNTLINGDDISNRLYLSYNITDNNTNNYNARQIMTNDDKLDLILNKLQEIEERNSKAEERMNNIESYLSNIIIGNTVFMHETNDELTQVKKSVKDIKDVIINRDIKYDHLISNIYKSVESSLYLFFQNSSGCLQVPATKCLNGTANCENEKPPVSLSNETLKDNINPVRRLISFVPDPIIRHKLNDISLILRVVSHRQETIRISQDKRMMTALHKAALRQQQIQKDIGDSIDRYRQDIEYMFNKSESSFERKINEGLLNVSELLIQSTDQIVTSLTNLTPYLSQKNDHKGNINIGNILSPPTNNIQISTPDSTNTTPISLEYHHVENIDEINESFVNNQENQNTTSFLQLLPTHTTSNDDVTTEHVLIQDAEKYLFKDTPNNTQQDGFYDYNILLSPKNNTVYILPDNISNIISLYDDENELVDNLLFNAGVNTTNNDNNNNTTTTTAPTIKYDPKTKAATRTERVTCNSSPSISKDELEDLSKVQSEQIQQHIEQKFRAMTSEIALGLGKLEDQVTGLKIYSTTNLHDHNDEILETMEQFSDKLDSELEQRLSKIMKKFDSQKKNWYQMMNAAISSISSSAVSSAQSTTNQLTFLIQEQIKQIKKDITALWLPCPSGYIRVEEQCLIALTDRVVPWDKAKQLCQASEGRLISTKNLKTLSSMLNTLGLQGTGTYWVDHREHQQPTSNTVTNLIDTQLEDRTSNTVQQTTCFALDVSDSIGLAPSPCERYYIPLCEPLPPEVQQTDNMNNSLMQG